jgi:hypothetical protein
MSWSNKQMSSLGDIQQIYNLLQQIDALLTKIESHSKTTDRDIKQVTESYDKLEQVALRYLAIANRLGFTGDAQATITTIAQLIVMARQAQIAFSMLEASMGPVGWAMFAASGIMIGLSATELGGSYL